MNSTSHPLVSVVTPVYNDEQFLAECLESILAQTYTNWNLIVANNCSTDSSGDIARKYAARDSRIRVHYNEQFLRAVPNYNSALRLISPESKYCKIVFADDWIFPECLKEMVAVAEEHPSVGIVGACGLQGPNVMWTGLPYPSRMVTGRDVCRRLFLDDLYVFGTGTSLLFRADVVRGRDPFYNEGNLHADSEACCALLKTCDFGFVHQILTFTREREGSLTSFSRDLNTLIAGRLHDLVTYGPDHLSPKELAACIDRKLDEYYEFLAQSVARRRNQKFWEYHKRKLTEAGVGFDRVRLAKAFLGKVADAVLNPRSTLQKMRQHKRASHDTAFIPHFHENRVAR
jgi:glycosyltransferase involved in cell wall biosynthesis